MEYLTSETLQVGIDAVATKGGYIDNHDKKFYPAEKFAGLCVLKNGDVGFLMEASIFCINWAYVDEDGTLHLSQNSITGTLVYKDLHSEEDWKSFNDSLLFGKVKEVLLKDNTHFTFEV